MENSERKDLGMLEGELKSAQTAQKFLLMKFNDCSRKYNIFKAELDALVIKNSKGGSELLNSNDYKVIAKLAENLKNFNLEAIFQDGSKVVEGFFSDVVVMLSPIMQITHDSNPLLVQDEVLDKANELLKCITKGYKNPKSILQNVASKKSKQKNQEKLMNLSLNKAIESYPWIQKNVTEKFNAIKIYVFDLESKLKFSYDESLQQINSLEEDVTSSKQKMQDLKAQYEDACDRAQLLMAEVEVVKAAQAANAESNASGITPERAKRYGLKSS